MKNSIRFLNSNGTEYIFNPVKETVKSSNSMREFPLTKREFYTRVVNNYYTLIKNQNKDEKRRDNNSRSSSSNEGAKSNNSERNFCRVPEIKMEEVPIRNRDFFMF